MGSRERRWAKSGPRDLCGARAARVLGHCLLVMSALSGSVGSRDVAHAEPVVPESRIESARGVALGTGARAGARSTQAQQDNPANLAWGGVAHMESLFAYQPQLKTFALGAAVVDSMTSSHIAAGLSTRFLFGDNSAGEHSGWEGRLSLGVPIGDLVSIGLAGRYGNFTVSNPHVRPQRPPAEDEEPDRSFKFKAFTLDAAVTLRLGQSFTLSAIGTNLIDHKTPLAPLMVGGAAAFMLGNISLGADLLTDLNLHNRFNGAKIQVGGGLEYLTQGLIPLRIGYAYDQGRHTHALTGGLGYLDQRFGIQLSVRQLVKGPKDTTLFASIQYFVQ